jgi:polar amino acid transport system ATP-binding protein
MIDIENLHKSFGDVHVLKGIDLNIKEKEVVANHRSVRFR